MDVKDVLQFTDRLFFSETGKHIDRLQETIVKGTLDGQKYSEIAEEEHCTEGHVRNVASELWQILSNALGQEVNKSNFRATFKRLNFANIWNFNEFNKDIVQIGEINFCENTSPSQKVPNSPTDKETLNKGNAKPKVREYLGEMPKFGSFYDRTSELTTLKQWILHENTRLLAIHGIIGIGKSAIAAQLVEQIKHEFDFIIWRSLATSPPLSILQTNIIQSLCRGGAESGGGAPLPAPSADGVTEPEEIKGNHRGLPLLEYLRKYRCLLIFDDVQTIYSSGQLAGTYQPGYQDYGTLLRQLAELSHNSCILLLSWDQPREIAALEGENSPVRSLQLNGLGAAREIFREKGLTEEENWSELIEIYRGNPLWLKIVATMIIDLFNGSVSELLSYQTLFLGDLESLLHPPFNRLSDLEKQVISWLANETAPASLSQIPENMQISPSDLLKILQSLGRRSLIDKVKQGNQTLFTLPPVVREFVKTFNRR